MKPTAKNLISEEPWRIIKSLLPAEPPKSKGGRPRLCDREVLSGIVHVLETGIP